MPGKELFCNGGLLAAARKVGLSGAASVILLASAAAWSCDSDSNRHARHETHACDDPIGDYLACTALGGEKCRKPEPSHRGIARTEGYGKSKRVISQYDDIMRYISLLEDHDWRLLSAIAYEESRFRNDVVSARGARGIMQITPVVARQFDVNPEDIDNPEVSISLAAKLLNKIGRMLRFSPGISRSDRLRIILACYNAGVGHIVDARRLALKYSDDPDSWEVVSFYLQHKSEPEYYEDEVVESGRFTGYAQTAAFVDCVMSRYDKYCRIASL